jgi:hypothetical protein
MKKTRKNKNYKLRDCSNKKNSNPQIFLRCLKNIPIIKSNLICKDF